MQLVTIITALALALTYHFTNKEIDALKKRVSELEDPKAEESDEVCG